MLFFCYAALVIRLRFGAMRVIAKVNWRRLSCGSRMFCGFC